MRMFYNSLITSMPESNDGGECIYLTPDASGGDVGHGFTCTGLFFKEFNGDNPRFWVGNDGRDREPAAGGSNNFLPSIVLVELDYSAENGMVLPATHYATKIMEIKTENLNKGTVQGVIEANDGTLWFISHQNIINIEPYADVNGDAIEISRFTVTGANGLAYDDVNNQLLIKPNGTGDIGRYEMDGTLVKIDEINVAVGIDQMNYNSATGVFYGGSGSNGSPASLRTYDIHTGNLINTYSGYTNVLASEGVAIVEHPDGKTYLYYASDAWFHQTGIAPDLAINAIHKLEIQL